MTLNPAQRGLLAILTLMSAALSASAASFGEDIIFLKAHTDVLILKDAAGQGQIAVVPAWQGRVMTSSSAGETGFSYGWINRELIASGRLQPHINAFGGEDRFWMGPEGGQFSIFFARGADFTFENWYTPAPLDTEPFKLISRSGNRAVLGAKFGLTNYSGMMFEVELERSVELLDAAAAWKALGTRPVKDVSLVAYATDNRVKNAGKESWKKHTGLLSVWILGMFNPSPETTIVVPIKAGAESELGAKVTADYFGEIPPDRLVVKEGAVFLSADGRYRSKVGISPRRSRGVLGSYDAEHNVLTIVQFTQPSGVNDYVNSLWKLQDDPYSGDAANAYNDGPVAPGLKPMGPFYELESSSPALALEPGETASHVHRTMHLQGNRQALDVIARRTLGVELNDIQQAFQKNSPGAAR